MARRRSTDTQSSGASAETPGAATGKPAKPRRQTGSQTAKAYLPALVEHNGTGPTAEVTVTDEGLEVLEVMARLGHSSATIAKTLGVGDKTLQRLRARDERVATAWASGRGALEDELVGHLLAYARKGNIAATIFALKSMAGYSDNPRPKDDRPPAITINLPGSMTEADYRRMLNVTPAVADDA
jgi:predicted DNA-binding protein (UPF0251 family)